MDGKWARLTAILAGASVLGGLALAVGITVLNRASDPFAQCREGVVAGEARIGGPFTLTDQNGRRADETVLGDLALVYFGYAYCPDICPLDMARNAAVARGLADQGIALTPVFISIDPERDTPEVLQAFTEGLGDVVALSGSTAETEAVARAYAVYFAKNGEDEFYLMDHSTHSYLMSADRGFLDFYRRDASEAQIAASVACFAGALES